MELCGDRFFFSPTCRIFARQSIFLIDFGGFLMMYLKSKVLVTQSCLTLCNPMDPWNSTRLLCPWNPPGKNTGVGCHSVFQGIFPTQGLNLDLPHCRQILLPPEPPGKPFVHLDGLLKLPPAWISTQEINSPIWGPCAVLSSQDRVPRPAPGQTLGTQGSCRGLSPQPSCPYFGLHGQGKVGFNLVEASPQKARC